MNFMKYSGRDRFKILVADFVINRLGEIYNNNFFIIRFLNALKAIKNSFYF